MASNKETTVKVSRWLVGEVEKYISRNKVNRSEFPSKRNFVDRALMSFLLNKGVELNKK